ncbi:Gfo/Idh/MocA family oxidoreductase [Enterobacteriaceae bacterium H18W14]|uniref:Gfo/Idh/MocA family oxidoreductase n=1 Tax=Dryocola boscaweniae TaxID=2925397 RepID=UPI0022F0C285|nr:Gfo/Idh/MocA family oxidoreductase [Dryocola boscaweniae]MCT4717384.1 Gfo/Idh/MocA family oxidoreductase [Dryocola boscaweniae]
MLVGLIGTGAVVETAYLPAISRLSLAEIQCYGFDPDPAREPQGVTRCDSLADLLALPLDIVFITTPSLLHLPVLETVLKSKAAQIVVEKPVAATLEQLTTLGQWLEDPAIASRVLALDHWMVRTDAAQFIKSIGEIERIEGFLFEPSGFNDAGEPAALNFATGQADTRQLRHPDGVIVDIGTHVLAMMRETVHKLGGNDNLAIELVYARDRLGNSIRAGDLTTAEGDAMLRGTLSDIPFTLALNKYAGPAGGQKGMKIYLHDGRIVNVDRRGADEVTEVLGATSCRQQKITGPLYDRCLGEVVFGDERIFMRNPQAVPALTRRRMAEVKALLEIQQALRGKH